MNRRSKTYRNKIDAMLGITLDDVAEIQKRSPLTKQLRRQKTRWSAHIARKNA